MNMHATTTHTRLQGHARTRLAVSIFIITICHYMVQVMRVGDKYDICIQGCNTHQVLTLTHIFQSYAQLQKVDILDMMSV